ncbi:MAG: ATP-binding protein [Acidobacteria bacterium]|nr:ATP-binding protein [Acidobacteriota bacterium]
MKRRALTPKLRILASSFPAVYVGGPRQSGKTTLARAAFPSHAYVSLEDPDEREFARTDPRGFLARFPAGAVLDEVQRAPTLFSYLQGIIDENRRPGRFILTGSQQFLLMRSVSQTLAGRIAIVTLPPFSLAELREVSQLNAIHFDQVKPNRTTPRFNLDWILRQGLYPAVHETGSDAVDWMASYYRTYVERDVRELLAVGDIELFGRFVRLCAGRSGQLLNLSSLGSDAGVAQPTARRWLSVLVASGLVHLLQPHHANFSKRLIKSPKLYFLDSGFLCYLLRITRDADVATHPLRGAIFETFVVSELVKVFAAIGREPPLFFWRDQTGHEVDLVIDLGGRLIPVEIKSGTTIARDFFAGLGYWLDLSRSSRKRGVLVYGGGEEPHLRDGHVVRPWFACS